MIWHCNSNRSRLQDDGDNRYVISVMSDTEKYSDVETLTDADNGKLISQYHLSLMLEYTVTLYNLADVDEPIITKNFYMTESMKADS